MTADRYDSARARQVVGQAVVAREVVAPRLRELAAELMAERGISRAEADGLVLFHFSLWWAEHHGAAQDGD